MPIAKRIQRYGNRAAIVLGEPIPQALGLDEGSEVHLTPGGQRPGRPEHAGSFGRRSPLPGSLLDVDARYGLAFKHPAGP